MTDYRNNSFWQLRLRIPKDVSIEVEQFLIKSGSLGYYELLYADGVTANLSDDFTVLFFFFAQDFPVQAVVPMAMHVLGIAEYESKITEVKYEDYVKKFEDSFFSFPLSEKTWLCPPWDLANEKIPAGAKKLLLRPGLAFGTGKHATTQLMVGFLEKHTRAGDRCYDLGCGSGILAIAAALHGAGECTGIDIESMAIDSAQQNAQLNTEHHKLATRFEFAVGDFDAELLKGACDLFVANILPQVFYHNPEQLKALLEGSERWALSGIPGVEGPRFYEFLAELLPGFEPGFDSLEEWTIFYRA